jgi:hypothetical protein
MHPSRRLLVLILICGIGLAPGCFRSPDDPSDDALRFITVTTTGPVNVSFWWADDKPFKPDSAYEWSTPQRPQAFELRTKLQITAKFEFTKSDAVAITFQVGHVRRTILGPAEEVTKDARFVLTESSGTVATLTFSRDAEFDDLRMEIDHGADGTIDAERAPDTVED